MIHLDCCQSENVCVCGHFANIGVSKWESILDFEISVLICVLFKCFQFHLHIFSFVRAIVFLIGHLQKCRFGNCDPKPINFISKKATVCKYRWLASNCDPGTKRIPVKAREVFLAVSHLVMISANVTIPVCESRSSSISMTVPCCAYYHVHEECATVWAVYGRLCQPLLMQCALVAHVWSRWSNLSISYGMFH